MVEPKFVRWLSYFKAFERYIKQFVALFVCLENESVRPRDEGAFLAKGGM